MTTDLRITSPRVLMKGLTARPTRRDVVSVELHYAADPIGLDAVALDRERRRLGCTLLSDGTWEPSWKWEKEMELAWTAQAGKPVFERSWQNAQKPSLRDPKQTLNYEIKHVGDGRWEAVLSPAEGLSGPIKVWIMPTDLPAGVPAGAVGVRQFGIGSDIGEGVGASDSTLQGFAADNREQAFEFASNTITPTDLGRLAAALGRMYNDALVCPVRKMHGITMMRALMDECGYRMVWRDKITDKSIEFNAKNYGWPKGEASSPWLFGKYRDAMEKRGVILHSLILWQQQGQYIYDTDGRITSASLVNLPPEVRDRHGDLVIGACLAYRACLDMPQFVADVPVEVPKHSMQWFKDQDAAQQRKAKNQW